MASSITQAREGTLYLMIGGKQEVFESVKDLLDDLSINLRFVGEPAVCWWLLSIWSEH